jgi:hypothetical protein
MAPVSIRERDRLVGVNIGRRAQVRRAAPLLAAAHSPRGVSTMAWMWSSSAQVGSLLKLFMRMQATFLYDRKPLWLGPTATIYQ